MMHNAELVARLERERCQPMPKQTPDTPDEVARRLRVLEREYPKAGKPHG